MIFGQKIIFFKTTHPTAVEFGILVPRDDLVKFYKSGRIFETFICFGKLDMLGTYAENLVQVSLF